MSEIKKCKKCGKEFPATLEYFTKGKGCKGGIRGKCRVCTALMRKQYSLANRESIAKAQEAYRIKYREVIRERDRARYQVNKNAIAEYQKLYAQKNKEKIAKAKKIYRDEHREEYKLYCKVNALIIAENRKLYKQKNKEHIAKLRKIYTQKNSLRILERTRKYIRANKELYCGYTQKRKARLKQLPYTLTTQQWEEIKNHFNYSCAYCGENKPLEQEHYHPLTQGGEYTTDNIICACKSCNSSKSNKSCHEWWIKQPHYSESREQKILAYLGYKKGIQQLSLV